MKKIFSFLVLLTGLFTIFSLTVDAGTTPGYNLVRSTLNNDRYMVTYNNSTRFDSSVPLYEDALYLEFQDHNLLNVSRFAIRIYDATSHGLQGEYISTLADTNYTFITLYNDGDRAFEIEIYQNDANSLLDYLNLRDEGQEWENGFFIEIEVTALDNVRPAISGQENFVTSVDDPKDVNFFKSFLTAYDDTDGNISSSIYVVTDNYTTNKTVLGRYLISFGVKDSAGNESILETYVNVVDTTDPIITGNNSKIQISYTQTFNINAFKTTLIVTDNYHTLTNENITIKSDGYTSNKTNLGTYAIEFEVVDPSGNSATFTKQVEVIDDIAPVFNGHSVVTKNNNATLTLSEIKAGLTAHDEKEGNKTNLIQVKEDNYTGNGHRIGSYEIVFEVSDSKGNIAEHVVTVRVVDNLPPLWYIQDGVSIKIVQPATLTREQMIQVLTATGQINVTATTQINFLLDEYTGNEEMPGIYAMSFRLTDTAGNEKIHNFAITVLENENDNDETIVIEPEGNWFDKNKTTLITFGIIGFVVIIGVSIVANKPKRRSYSRKRNYR